MCNALVVHGDVYASVIEMRCWCKSAESDTVFFFFFWIPPLGLFMELESRVCFVSGAFITMAQINSEFKHACYHHEDQKRAVSEGSV